MRAINKLFLVLFLTVVIGCGGEKIKQKELWISGTYLCQEGLGRVADCEDSPHGGAIHAICSKLGYRYE